MGLWSILLFAFAVVAFLVALHQNGPLLGKDGLLPADKFLSDVKRGNPGSTKYSLFQVRINTRSERVKSLLACA